MRSSTKDVCGWSCSCGLDTLFAKSPFTGGFSDGLEHVVFRFPEGFWRQELPDVKDTPFMRPSSLHGNTADNAPMPLATKLSQMVQDVMSWTPNTDWGGGYTDRNGTYLTIGAQQKPPLEYERYSFAIIDTEDLLTAAQEQEAVRRALARMPKSA